MKYFKLLILTISINHALAGCEFRTSAPPPTTDHSDQTTVEPIPSPSPTPTPSPRKGVELVPVAYYTTEAERDLIKRAGDKMRETVASPCYFNFMSKRAMIQTNGKTAAQVATEFVNASGVIPVEFYYSRFTSARAYRQPPSNTIHLNRKFIWSGSDLCDVAGTLAHESVGHSLLNYDHDFEWSPSREYSAPYSSDHAFAKEAYSGSPSGGCCL